MTSPDHAPRYGGVPASPCDDRCVTPGSRTGALRAARRAAGLAAVLALALATAPLLLLPLPPVHRCWLRTVARGGLRATGVRVRVRDARGAEREGGGGALLVANHLSWIEVVALLAVSPVRLVAKAEIRRWPLLWAVAGATGALYLDRAALRALPRAVAAVTAALETGDVVAAFPEGTTWCGRAAGPFRHAVFQAALDAGVPVRPVAVVLRWGGSTAHEAAFVGDHPLAGSVLRVLRVPALVCELTLLPELEPVGTRAELAARAARAIGSATGVPHPTRPGTRRRARPDGPRIPEAVRPRHPHAPPRRTGPRHGLLTRAHRRTASAPDPAATRGTAQLDPIA